MTDRPQESRVKLIAALALAAILVTFVVLYLRGQRGDQAAREQAESSPNATSPR